MVDFFRTAMEINRTTSPVIDAGALNSISHPSSVFLPFHYLFLEFLCKHFREACLYPTTYTHFSFIFSSSIILYIHIVRIHSLTYYSHTIAFHASGSFFSLCQREVFVGNIGEASGVLTGEYEEQTNTVLFFFSFFFLSKISTQHEVEERDTRSRILAWG